MSTHKHNIYLIRHGETPWSLSGQHTGTTDISLTDNGKNQALQIKKRLQSNSFAAIFCSPLKRAQQTCQLAGLNPHAQLDPYLVEWNYGDYEGLTTPVIRKQHPHWNIFKDGAPHGESPQEIYSRAKKVLASLTEITGDVAIFSHGHFLRVLTTVWLKLPIEKGALFSLFPGSISVLGFEREQHVITLWNETSHIIPNVRNNEQFG